MSVRDSFSYGEFVKVGEGILPRMGMKKLVELLASGKRQFPEEVVREIVSSGLLSLYSDGNYSPVSGISPGFCANPVLRERRVYFTLKGDCLDFAERAYGLVRIVRHGEFPLQDLPALPDTRQWRELRLKVMRGEEKDVLQRMKEKGLLTRDMKFSVEFDLGKKQGSRGSLSGNPLLNIITNFGQKTAVYYFPGQEIAQSYADSLPVRWDKKGLIRVVNNRV